MTWVEGPYAPFDVESSGVSVTEDRIVTAYVGKVGKGLTAEHRDWLVNPGIAIPDEAVAIHKVTTEYAFEHGQPAPAAVNEIAQTLADHLADGTPIVGFNVAFDLSMLAAECARNGVPTVAERLGRPECPVVDGLVLDKFVDRYRRGSRKLVDTARVYGIDLAEIDAHGARADALAAARVVWRIATRYPKVGGLTLLELHDLQVQAAAEQAEGFREYLARQGKPSDDVDGSWPVRASVLATSVAWPR